LGCMDVFPQAKINPRVVFPHHPPQKHVEALAGTACLWRTDVLARSGEVVAAKKIVSKTHQRLFYGFVCC